jgi:two-component system NarL family response regulator/two-component system nitrate/nitrite response regulator NarL
MPDMKGLQVARELRRQKFPVSIVMLSACDDEHFIRETLRAGVDGYLNKSEPPSAIREMIRRVSEKHLTAIAPLLLLLLPKLSIVFVQSLGS